MFLQYLQPLHVSLSSIHLPVLTFVSFSAPFFFSSFPPLASFLLSSLFPPGSSKFYAWVRLSWVWSFVTPPGLPLTPIFRKELRTRAPELSSFESGQSEHCLPLRNRFSSPFWDPHSTLVQRQRFWWNRCASLPSLSPPYPAVTATLLKAASRPVKQFEKWMMGAAGKWLWAESWPCCSLPKLNKSDRLVGLHVCLYNVRMGSSSSQAERQTCVVKICSERSV